MLIVSRREEMPKVMEIKLDQPPTPEQEVEMWMMLYDIAISGLPIVDLLADDIKECCPITRKLWNKLKKQGFLKCK